MGRLTLVAVAGLALIVAIISPASRQAALWSAGLAGAAFLIVAILHDRVEQRRRLHEALVRVNREAQDRLARRWAALPDPPPVPVDDDHPYAVDLDVVGHASLYQLLGPPNTPAGRDTLTGWLLDVVHTEPDVVLARQDAVRELAPAIDLRQRLQAAGVDAARVDAKALDTLLAWAQSKPALLHRPLLLWTIRLLTVATPLLALGGYLGLVNPSLWVIGGVAGWIIMGRTHKAMHAAFDAASCEHALRTFEQLVQVLSTASFSSPLLAEAHRELVSARGVSAHDALRRLHQYVALSDLRLTLLFHFPIQTLFLWDFHAWWLLERWQQAHGAHLREWLSAAGRVEALTALASLAHAQPAWTYPVVTRGHARVDAAALGHPLLPDTVRVTNDITVGPAGTFLLITGSNMSGKSTLLRAIGLNTVLAHAGAPVCASSFTLPPVVLRTSMRVSDSLERGLSLFMASLLRLERVVAAARDADPRTRPLLYLLDEVLQGTNSAERQIAVRTIVQHLLRRGAIGVVTTHDLELAAAPDFAAHADSRHLTETLSFDQGEVRMTFDYTLREGPARSGNALQLLRSLGLDAETLDRVTPP